MLPREKQQLGFGLLHQLLKLPPSRVAREPEARLAFLCNGIHTYPDQLQALVESIDALQAIALASDDTRRHRTAEMRAALAGVRVRSLSLRARSRGGGGGGGGADGTDADAARRAAMRALRAAMLPLVEHLSPRRSESVPGHLPAGQVARWAADVDRGVQQAVSRLLVKGIAHLAVRAPVDLHEACRLAPPTTTESVPSLLAHSLGAIAARASRSGWANARLVVTVARSALNDTTGTEAIRSSTVERSIEMRVPASQRGDVANQTIEVGGSSWKDLHR